MTDKPLDEANRLSARVKRYTRVGASVSGIAARVGASRVASRVTGTPANAQSQGADLKAALGNLKGPLMKVGQMLANIPDAVPEDMARELASLQSSAPPMGWNFVRRRMATELGPDWQDKFANFERSASKAASLGQVHLAEGLDGETLACKLQYPDMDSTLEADLNQLQLILKIYRRLDDTINFETALEEICARLREELNYEREAANLRVFQHIFKDQPEFCLPEVKPDLSTRRLLTMSWLHGSSVKNYLDAPQETRNRIADRLYKAWYTPFFRYGLINGDPHMGNYTVPAPIHGEELGHRINLFDLGLVRVFPPEIIMASINLFHGLDQGDEERAFAACKVLMGQQNLSREIYAAANVWSEFLFRPILTKGATDLHSLQTTEAGREAAREMHHKMKALGGGVTLPAVFVFMDRAAVGLGGTLLRLAPIIDCRSTFFEFTQDLTLEAIRENQRQALAAGGIA